jgi:D-tyrosyl-tRNA(Tyr) deacylase
MIGLLQRVSRASVTVNNQIVGKIDVGLLVLVAIQRNDATAQAKRLLERLLTYRVFEDEAGRMNLDVTQVNGGLLFVPQFTLAANTLKMAQGCQRGFRRQYGRQPRQ